MPRQTLNDVFVHLLSDVYSAEKQLTQALPKMARAATDPAVIGGQSHIPIESIRMKRIRDGREDYEYLRLVAAKARAPYARATASSVPSSSASSPTCTRSGSRASSAAGR